MARLISDENFHGDVIRGLLLRYPELDLVRVQDVGLMASDDEVILQWAATEGRILLSHDIKTIPPLVRDRLAKELPVAGVCFVKPLTTIGRAIDEIAVAIFCSSPHEWKDQMVYLPL